MRRAVAAHNERRTVTPPELLFRWQSGVAGCVVGEGSRRVHVDLQETDRGEGTEFRIIRWFWIRSASHS